MCFNWDNGSWRSSSNTGPAGKRIIVTGDWAPIRDYERIILDTPAGIYGDLLPLLQNADLRIVNLEAPLSNSGSPIVKDGPNLRGVPEAISGLTVVPFDVACLANNHIMDFGQSALQDTLDALDANSIAHVGAGLSGVEAQSPLIVRLDGIKLGIVNFSEGEDGTAAGNGPGVFGWDLAAVIDTVTTLKESVDVAIVVGHAGREHTPVPAPYIQSAYRQISKAGADLVVGHHPHVPQGIEIFSGVPIVYSLGNFIFQQKTGSIFKRHGYLLSLDLNTQGVCGFNLIPYALTDQGARQLTESEGEWFMHELKNVSEPLASPALVNSAWEAFVDSFGRTYWSEQLVGIPPLIDQCGQTQQKTIAKLRNSFLCPAHHHFYATGFDRLISGKIGTAEAWASVLIQRWSRPNS